ncbi:alpha/beta fold hydrolase [uncultured Amnibacterium sp.]|uniref:alpha/beta fold hydrolase n=1 Tax=uncultured Amnibacterium sp. TaxID=1631851 RepID=UPI0035C95C28
MTGTVSLHSAWTGTGRPLVLIMGLGAGLSAWDRHVSAWSRDFACLAVDNRGAGRSPAPDGPYTTALMADDIARLLDELAVEPVDVVGISMGGAIAQELALRHPARLRRLVLVATWARSTPYLSDVLDTLAASRKCFDTAEYVTALQTLIWTPEALASRRGELLADRRGPLDVGPVAFDSQVAACKHHDALDRLGDIDLPVLVTAGRADRFVPLTTTAEVAERLSRADFVEFESGHVHHYEEAARFNGLVAEWLR